ncbi:MAG: type 1 glutamine amidotransferase domain-containing protein [bacterium]
MARILIPLPDTDFDVTEVAVPWRLAVDAGHEVVFATELGGAAPTADPRLLTGVIFGKLGAAPDALACYRSLEQDTAFRAPIAWGTLDPLEFDGLLLPGGHAPGMRQYLGSGELQAQVVRFWRTGRPVGAICHGVLVLARALDPGTGRSVLADVRTTCLPAYMEWLAYLLTFWKLGRYYRTYRATVQREVQSALDRPRHQFVRGPLTLGARGTDVDDSPAFVVEDGRYVSARWPGDAWLFGRRFLARLA